MLNSVPSPNSSTLYGAHPALLPACLCSWVKWSRAGESETRNQTKLRQRWGTTVSPAFRRPRREWDQPQNKTGTMCQICTEASAQGWSETKRHN